MIRSFFTEVIPFFFTVVIPFLFHPVAEIETRSTGDVQLEPEYGDFGECPVPNLVIKNGSRKEINLSSLTKYSRENPMNWKINVLIGGISLGQLTPVDFDKYVRIIVECIDETDTGGKVVVIKGICSQSSDSLFLRFWGLGFLMRRNSKMNLRESQNLGVEVICRQAVSNYPILREFQQEV